MISSGPLGTERLPSAEAESRGFQRLQWRLTRTQISQEFTTSRLRVSLVLILTFLLWMGLYYLVRDGFLFMIGALLQPLYEQITSAIFNAFFLFLFVMLVFSSAVILYSSLFRGKEVAFLLTMPIRAERIFLHKFWHAILFSSWGFVLLGSPMLVAYGVVVHASWYYYALILPLLVSFVFIPAGLGAILLLLVMRFFPRNRMHLMIAGSALLIVAGIWFFWSVVSRPETDLLTPRWFQEMLGRLQLTEKAPLPSWWLSSGLLETARHEWSEGMLFLTLLVANALFVRELAAEFAARIYRTAYCRAAAVGSGSGRIWMTWIDKFLAVILSFLPRHVRLVVLKDLRLFRRDPLQWAQFVILFFLLILYFVNVHPFSETMHVAQWVSVVSFMNLSVVGLLMSTFTTRFIFPMISLEGRRFWLLGLLPLKRDSILWAKFFFSIMALSIPCALLITLSDTMLAVPRLLAWQHQWTSLLLCFGLSGISVGLGAKLPNFREQSPSRIAAGFGGTLNLVVSTAYIIAILMMTTLPCHLYVARQIEPNSYNSELARLHLIVRPWLISGLIASGPLAAAVTLLPMWFGIRSFRRMEFH